MNFAHCTATSRTVPSAFATSSRSHFLFSIQSIVPSFMFHAILRSIYCLHLVEATGHTIKTRLQMIAWCVLSGQRNVKTHVCVRLTNTSAPIQSCWQGVRACRQVFVARCARGLPLSCQCLDIEYNTCFTGDLAPVALSRLGYVVVKLRVVCEDSRDRLGDGSTIAKWQGCARACVTHCRV